MRGKNKVWQDDELGGWFSQVQGSTPWTPGSFKHPQFPTVHSRFAMKNKAFLTIRCVEHQTARCNESNKLMFLVGWTRYKHWNLHCLALNWIFTGFLSVLLGSSVNLTVTAPEHLSDLKSFSLQLFWFQSCCDLKWHLV